MPGSSEPVVRVREVSKNYRGLRPLRVRSLDLQPGQSLALMGFDQTTAEVLVDLITGATLPESGEVTALGKPTASIRDGDEWLQTLDQFGLLSDRAVLVEQFTVEQNLAIPLSLDVEEMPDVLRASVRQLADETGLGALLGQQTGTLGHAARLRVRLGRALALTPRILLAEHPNASLSSPEASTFATDLRVIIARRELASIVMTADAEFAHAVADRVMTLEPGTGELKPARRQWSWVSRFSG